MDASRSGAAAPGIDFIAFSNRIGALKAGGRDIVDMFKGEYDGGPPDRVREALARAARDDPARYTDLNGMPALKAAIAAKLSRDNRLDFGPDEILVTCGANQAMQNAIGALVSPGDDAVLVAPYWPPFLPKLRAAGAHVVVVATEAAAGYRLSPEMLSAALGPRSRLLVLNSPCNPTGRAYDAAELAALGDVILRHPRLVVLWDDVYEATRFDGRPVNLLNVCPELRPRTIIANSLSKAYAMSGWRIGYAAASAELIDRMAAIQVLSTFSPSSPAQIAAVAALEDCPDHPIGVRRILQRRHDRMLAALRRIPGLRVRPADGAFYLFADVSGLCEGRPDLRSDGDLAGYLLERADLAVAPGSAFGAPGHIRLCFAVGDALIDRAMAGLQRLLGSGAAGG